MYDSKRSSLGKVKKTNRISYRSKIVRSDDVRINYQVKETKNKNYLRLNITIDKWDKITE